jgi:glyoxalase family protein
MTLEGLHHITAITADAPSNVEFYVGVLGLRLVKKTVNFDAPDVYHLYYGDEVGAPGSILTFFEFPGVARGRRGAGAIHLVQWRVGSGDTIAFWRDRLAARGIETTLEDAALHFEDPEGLRHALLVADVDDPPLRAAAPDIPSEHALRGFHGVRAYAAGDLEAARPALDAIGLQETEPGVFEAAGERRRGRIAWDPAPGQPHREGAGSVHHVAWNAADDEELLELRRALTAAGGRPTPIIDRRYFHSVYQRLPTGVLFELATRDIGFTLDERPDSLGQALKLPPQHAGRRAELERSLTPLPDPRGEVG